MGGSKSKPTPEQEKECLEAFSNGPEWEDREVGSFVNSGGDCIHYRKWLPKAGTKVVAMLFTAHGLHEHCGRSAHVAHWFTRKGLVVLANDHIGHGLTTEGKERGMIRDYTKMTDGFVEFVENMVEQESDKTLPVYIVGHSMGSLVATVASVAIQNGSVVGSRLKKLVLSGCPLVVGPAAGSPLGLRCLHPMTRNTKRTLRLAKMLASVNPKGPAAPLDRKSLSLDKEVVERAWWDPLSTKGSIRNKTALEVMKLVVAVKKAAPEVTTQTMLIHGGSDDIALPEGSTQLFDLLEASPGKQIKIYDGLLHEVLNHKSQFEGIISEIDSFLSLPVPEEL